MVRKQQHQYLYWNDESTKLWAQTKKCCLFLTQHGYVCLTVTENMEKVSYLSWAITTSFDAFKVTGIISWSMLGMKTAITANIITVYRCRKAKFWNNCSVLRLWLSTRRGQNTNYDNMCGGNQLERSAAHLESLRNESTSEVDRRRQWNIFNRVLILFSREMLSSFRA